MSERDAILRGWDLWDGMPDRRGNFFINCRFEGGFGVALSGTARQQADGSWRGRIGRIVKPAPSKGPGRIVEPVP